MVLAEDVCLWRTIALAVFIWLFTWLLMEDVPSLFFMDNLWQYASASVPFKHPAVINGEPWHSTGSRCTILVRLPWLYGINICWYQKKVVPLRCKTNELWADTRIIVITRHCSSTLPKGMCCTSLSTLLKMN